MLVAIPDIHFLMKAKGAISPDIYWWDVRRLRSLLRTTAITVAGFILLAFGLYQLKPDYNNIRAAYFAWRTAKANSTPIDQSRTRQGMFDLMADDAAAANATRRLAALLRRPALPMERVDLALRILLESRMGSRGNAVLPQHLVQSLRTDSVDARNRINEVLKFLAVPCKVAPPKDLMDWKPTDGDSTVVLEQKINSWAAYWITPCEPKPASPA